MSCCISLSESSFVPVLLLPVSFCLHLSLFCLLFVFLCFQSSSCCLCVCVFFIFYASVVHFISPLFSHLSSLTPSVRIAFKHFLCPHILYVTSRPFLFCYVTHSLPWQSMSSLHAFLYSSILFDSLLYSNLVSPALHFYSSFVPFPPCAIFPCTPQFSFQ